MRLPMKQARGIAAKHIGRTNPDGWNGTGPRPDSVDTLLNTYHIGDNAEIGIYFAYFEESGWLHVCELRDRNGRLTATGHATGIGDPDALAETIKAMYDGKELPGPGIKARIIHQIR